MYKWISTKNPTFKTIKFQITKKWKYKNWYLKIIKKIPKNKLWIIINYKQKPLIKIKYIYIKNKNRRINNP